MLLIGRWDELTAEYREGWLKAQQAGERRYQIKILMKQGELLCRRQEFEEGERMLRQALEMAKEFGNELLRERVEDKLAGAYLFTKRFDEAEAIVDRLCSLAEGRGNEPSLGLFLNQKATIALERGQIKQAISLIKRRINIAKKYGNPRDLAHGYLTLGGIYGASAKYKISYHYSRLSAGLCRKIGDIFMRYNAVYNMALACDRLGLDQEALAYYYEDLEMARQLGDGPGEAQILKDIAQVKEKIKVSKEEA